MSGILTTRFFAPATATTTLPDGVTTEFVSDSDGTYGIDVSAGYVDVSGSGVNFVPGGDYLRVRRLVDDVTTILGEASEAGTFLARAGLLAADGATGAGAGAGLAVAAARGALIFGGRQNDVLFAGGDGDPDEASGQPHGTATSRARQTPAERLAALRKEIAELVAQGDALEQAGDTVKARVQYEDAASIYSEIFTTGGLLPEAEFNSTLKDAIAVLRKAGDNEGADKLQKVLDARTQLLADAAAPEVANLRDVRSEEPKITPPHILKPIETARQIGLIRPESPLFELVRERVFGLVFVYAKLAVSEWFDLSLKERLDIIGGGNAEQVPADWFNSYFRGFFEDRTRGSAGAVAVAANDTIIPGEIRVRLETARQMGLIRPGSPIYNLAEERPFELIYNYVQLAVTDWFNLPENERLEINRENPNQAPESWFTAVFSGFFELRGGGATQAAAVEAAPEVGAVGPEAAAAVRPTPEITPPYVFANIEIERLAGEVFTDFDGSLFKMVEHLQVGRVARAIRTAVNDWVAEYGTREVPKDWFEFHFTGLLEDRSPGSPYWLEFHLTGLLAEEAPGAPVATLQAAAEDTPIDEIVWKNLLVDIATNWYVRQITDSESPIYQVLPTVNQEELEYIVRTLVEAWYNLPIEARLQWSNRPDVVPVNWFVTEANKTTARLLLAPPAKMRLVEPDSVKEIVPTYLLEAKEVRKYLILAQNTEGPLADLDLGDNAATREKVIRFGVQSWFAKPLAERAEIAPNNPDDMPIEWFKEWIRWIDKHI